jgi:glutamate dehydrogenase
LIAAVADALVADALPDELEGFDEAARTEAAKFVAEAAEVRPEKTPVVRLESVGGGLAARRRMRLAVINDDMPFLVDSVAAMIAGRGLIIHRLLHPILSVERDKRGRLVRLDAKGAKAGRHESFIYLEIDRAAASGRHNLVQTLDDVLADVRAAVEDWEALQARLRADADRLEDTEDAALLRWFADGAMTLLGYHVERPGEPPESPLGLLRSHREQLWDYGSCEGAIAYFREGGHVPLIAKADQLSSVHRHVPLDLIVLPIAEKGKVTAIGVHAGLWTSDALLRAQPDQVPVLRQRLAALEKEFGFDPRSHAGKALRHTVASLPRDLLVSLRPAGIKQLVTTAMSLADRPRPALDMLQSILRGHLFVFVWLPREELATHRRLSIAQMLEEETGGVVSSWSVELGEGELALIRYTLEVDPANPPPSARSLNARLVELVRGWEPSVEEALAALAGPARASRLALTLVHDFPDSYQDRTSASEAALDVIRLSDLSNAEARDARLYRPPSDSAEQLRLKTYRRGGTIALSEAVPVLENFGFRVVEEQPTPIGGGKLGTIHDFLLETKGDPDGVIGRAGVIERTIVAVLEGRAENDPFNQLLVSAGLEPDALVLFRAWFRYLRQIGLSYSLATAVEALRKAPAIARALIALFEAHHHPRDDGRREQAAAEADLAIRNGLAKVAAIDEDRILRLFRSLILATLRTNAFTVAGRAALAFKFDSSLIPGLPSPVPWREIWVYSPRVEGIHLRGGPIARGGLRWSDRRDDFRTEILGLMKAQVVKNAVIVPTGAKGGFYPKLLPPVSDREAWLAEGRESYRLFIRTLLSVTDNIVGGEVVHPEGMVIRDGEDPYFVVAADKGTAAFSDVANAIALDQQFWLGDGFASGGSQGYDHKAMGITARGAWVSVRRHFAEMGVDTQTDSIRIAGVGDMSGDVFGNGMLLSRAVKLVAAFDHRHIFIDPDPDPEASWQERERLFNLPRSSWDDYDRKLISKGGGVFPRTQKSIPLTAPMRRVLGIEAKDADPSTVIRAILAAPVDLLWFGGIGTYVKGSEQSDAEVGDPTNDEHRVTAREVRARVIGEGANLAITQAGRIEFSERGGRINTDFIDNSAGVDCSDNEVNIKIPLNREMAEGRLALDTRNKLLSDMTEDVAALVLEDNRLQTLALSIAECGGAAALPPLVRAIDILEESGRLNRAAEGLESDQSLLRRAQEDRGLTRPELAVLLSTSKMAMQAAIEASALADDPSLEDELLRAFPAKMRKRHSDAIRQHRLRREILATKIANRFVNRLGILAPFALAEEEGASWAQAAAGFVAAERLFGMEALWQQIEQLEIDEIARLELLEQAGYALRVHIADIVRSTDPTMLPGAIVSLLKPGLAKLDAVVDRLLRKEARAQAQAMSERLASIGAPAATVEAIVRLFKMNGAVGIAALGHRCRMDELALTRAYTRLGEALGLDWAQSAANRFAAVDVWERLLTASIARDFEQLRLDFLERQDRKDPEGAVESWVEAQADRVEQFRRLVARARSAPTTTIPMLAQIATQARVLLGR